MGPESPAWCSGLFCYLWYEIGRNQARKRGDNLKTRKPTPKEKNTQEPAKPDHTITASDGTEVYTDSILFYLDEWKEENGVQDLEKITQSRWNAVLMYIHDRAFPSKSILRNPHEFNSYNVSMLSDIADLYCELCFRYGKEVSLRGFSFLTGIDDSTIILWGNQGVRVSAGCFEIWKKLHGNHEESLRNRLYDKGGALGSVVLVNHDFSYNMPGGGHANLPPAKSNQELSESMGLLLSDNSSPENH